MSDTEQLFLVGAIWTLLAAAIARFIPNWPGRIAFVAIAVGIPFWELPYGYYNFQKLCREDGGLKVMEKISPQENVCADFPFDTAATDLLRFGFSSVEARGKLGEVRKVTSAQAASSDRQPRPATSAYCVTFKNNNHLPWGVIRHDFLVTRSDNGRVVARHSVFDWFGMWWQQMAKPILGRGGECRDDPIPAIASALRKGAN